MKSSMVNSQPELSIIIPAYNEEHRLPKSLDEITEWMQTVPFAVEVLIVENGSHDRTTEIAQSYVHRFPNIRLFHSAKGKGSAVRCGVMHSRGKSVFICDSDLSMPISEVNKFLSPHLSEYHLIIASREAPGAVRYNEPYYRHIMGRVFNFLVRILIVPGFHDTQCGFKFFRREVALDIFARQTITGWSFDVEALFVALRRNYQVVEIPIHWYFDADSRVSPLRDTWQMLRDVLRIRLNAIMGVYDQASVSQPIEDQATV